jgi:dihydrofolate reductase
MGKVFVSMGMSLDGYIAGTNRGPKNPLGDGGPGIHAWLFQQKAFREHLQLRDGGETGEDNRIVEATMQRPGASIMGKRMFEEGEAAWPEEAPFHTPVFVLTHEQRAPWPRPGGTTFYFVNDGIESALRQAREASGAKDVRISGGASTVLQYLHAGLVDELALDLAPVLLGKGLRLFDGLDTHKVAVELVETIPSPLVTHLRYAVRSVPGG